MGLDYYASAPVLRPPQVTTTDLPQQQDHHGGAVIEPSAPAFQFQTVAPYRNPTPKYPTPPSLNYQARASDAIAGRKRSRDDTDDSHSEDEIEPSSRPISMEVRPVTEPIMGPGMTLIYPDQPSLNISPESQSGTWMEEKADQVVIASRPILTARKSQRRINAGCSAPTSDDHTQIDPIVRQLGIGWKHYPEQQNVGLGGLETFIRRKFKLDTPRILLNHEGLSYYVVRSKHGCWHQFWLFREDLKSGWFLCNDEADLFRRLANKVRDERGNWHPHILTQGPEVFPVEESSQPTSSPSVFESNVNVNTAGAVCDAQQQSWQQEDVEMECVA